MGEQSVPPKENNNQNGKSDEEMQVESENEEELEDISPDEFERLDSTMDELNSALDAIEQKNDNIHAQLLQLLHANREVRQQLGTEAQNQASQESK
ncbi:unnamed protein product [Brassicogethes aeneus]|uniref:Uncharacterized protein n=1 Tax=Brassicogethes aeneus TaxID=1431903 RepID=A0A9P0FKF2_BRAAE|nr:unnamed protein product [Brassicogethes aeneus]